MIRTLAILALLAMAPLSALHASPFCPSLEDGHTYLFSRSETRPSLRFFNATDAQHPVLMVLPEMGVIDRGHTLCSLPGTHKFLGSADFAECPADLPVVATHCIPPYGYTKKEGDGSFTEIDHLWAIKIDRLKGKRAYVTYHAETLWIDLSTTGIKWKKHTFHEKGVAGC